MTKTAGVMAIAIGSVGTLAKLCSELVEGIDPGPVEAADAVGASRAQRLRWSVVPQVLPEISSFLLYRFEINIRVSAILGVVGAGGIGTLLYQRLLLQAVGCRRRHARRDDRRHDGGRRDLRLGSSPHPRRPSRRPGDR